MSEELKVTVKIPLVKIKQARKTLFDATAVGEKDWSLL